MVKGAGRGGGCGVGGGAVCVCVGGGGQKVNSQNETAVKLHSSRLKHDLMLECGGGGGGSGGFIHPVKKCHKQKIKSH